jgi:hypothetical protein
MDFAYIFACILALLAYSGLFGTVFLVIILVKERLLKEASFIIMFSLAFADISNLSTMAFHSLPERILLIVWPDWYEEAVNRTTLIFWYTSLAHYLLMALNRFTAVRYPLKVNVWFSFKRTVVYAILAWIVGFSVGAISFLNICCQHVFSIHDNLGEIEEADDEGTNYVKIATNFNDIFVIIIMIFLYIMTYSKINRTVPSSLPNNMANLRQNKENIRRSAQTKRISLQFAIISSIFGFLVITQALSNFSFGGVVLQAVFQLAFTINAGANVVIYSIFNSTFKNHLVGVLLCCISHRTATITTSQAPSTSRRWLGHLS